MALKEVKAFDFNEEIYPKNIMSPIIEAIKLNETFQHPKCMFVPDRQLVRKMVKALIRFGNMETYSEFFLRFGLVEDASKML